MCVRNEVYNTNISDVININVKNEQIQLPCEVC